MTDQIHRILTRVQKPARYVGGEYNQIVKRKQDIPGKERRKTAPGKEGLLGVEGMRPEILLQALRNAGADFEDAQAAPAREPVTKQDFFTLGLSGRPDSAAKRAALLQALSLPAHMSANALLQAVNVLFSREEFLARFVEP